MKQLRFRYTLQAAYSAPVRRHSFSLLFLPGDTLRQKIEALEVRFSPDTPFLRAKNSFGCQRAYGTVEAPHDFFEAHVLGTAVTGLDILEEYASDPVRDSLFLAQTPLTLPGEALRALREGMRFSPGDGPYDRALEINRRLHGALRYDPGLTRAHEGAESACAAGGGVCQDFAHIMLSLLRMEGIPARYAVGMTVGEGASHAWVEALCRGCWYGFDPTNGTLTDDGCIRVSCGRDSRDCAVIRGSFAGAAVQTQREKVLVEEIRRKGAEA